MENIETIKPESKPVDIEFSPSLLKDGIYKWNKIVCFQEKLNYNIDLNKIIQTLKEDIEKNYGEKIIQTLKEDIEKDYGEKIIQTLKEDIEKDYEEQINKIRDIETRNMRRKYYSYMNNLSKELDEKKIKLDEKNLKLNELEEKIVEMKETIVNLDEEKDELKVKIYEMEEECNKIKDEEEYIWNEKINRLLRRNKSLNEHNDYMSRIIKKRDDEIKLLKENNEEKLDVELKKKCDNLIIENEELKEENEKLQMIKKKLTTMGRQLNWSIK